MQITDPLTNPQLFIEKAKSEVLQQIQAGSTVRATVVAPPKNGLVELAMGGQTLFAKTNLKVSQGENLLLDVVKAGPKLELAVIKAPTMESLKADILRTLMPKQVSLQQLVNTIKLLTGEQVSARHSIAPNGVQNTATPLVNMPNAAPGGFSQEATQQLLQSILANAQSQTLNQATGVTPTIQSPVSQKMAEVLAAAFSATKKGEVTDPKSLQATPKDVQFAKQLQIILNHAVSDKSPLTPERLKLALHQSGLLLESNLAQGQPITVDIKSSLLKLLFFLKPLVMHAQATHLSTSSSVQAGSIAANSNILLRLMTELMAQSEGALARIQLNQMASLPQEESARQVWQFELPFNHSDKTEHVGIQIQRDEVSKEGEENTNWSVKLQFNIEPTGPITAHLILIGEEISSHFLATRSSSAETIEKMLPKLSAAFVAAGLKIGTVTAHHGDVNKAVTEYQPDFPILDERA